MVQPPELAERPKRVRRPLLWVLAACLIGDGFVRGSLPSYLVVIPALACLIPSWRARFVRGLGGQGLSCASLALFCAMAALRVSVATPPSEAILRGRWQTLSDDDPLVGQVEGYPQRYELPEGALRNGEWVELLVPPPFERAVPAAATNASPAPHNSLPGLVVLKADQVRRLGAPARASVTSPTAHFERMRASGLERVSHLDSPLTRGMAGALLFGDRRAMPYGLPDLFTRTGTRHALAISGLHVALVAALWIWPLGSLCALLFAALAGQRGLRLLSRKELWRVVLLALFVPLAGAGAPVVRAALALAIMQLAALAPGRGSLNWPRRTDGLSLWALAALFEWLAHPDAFTSLSLQLSYAATLGLMLLTLPFSALLRRVLPGAGRIADTNRKGRPRRPLLRIGLQKFVNGCVTGLAASFAANVATLPIVWTVFGEWSATGPVATLLLLPLLAVFMGLAWFWVGVPTDLVERVLEFNAQCMVLLLEFFDRLPGTPIPLPMRPVLLLLAGSVAVFLAVRWRRPWRQHAVRVASILWVILLSPWWRASAALELRVLDVGHGTCALLRVPDNGTWIFDAGSREGARVARDALSRHLRGMKVGPLRVALSHPESDHAGALDWLVERYPPVSWFGAIPAQLRERLPHGCDQLDLESGRLTWQSRRSLTERLTEAPAELPPLPHQVGIEMTLLRGLHRDGNEGSRTLEVRCGPVSLLLCGDGLARQLRAGLLRGPYDLVLFPHHGSETPWLSSFLAATRPREVWFSCVGRPPVADELDRRGIPWRATSSEGDLMTSW